MTNEVNELNGFLGINILDIHFKFGIVSEAKNNDQIVILNLSQIVEKIKEREGEIAKNKKNG